MHVQLAADVLTIVAGRGSYGSVYKAQVRGTQEVVAVKVIPLGDKDEVLEIQKEIEMLKECNHPNVVRYLVRCNLGTVLADTLFPMCRQLMHTPLYIWPLHL